MLRILDICFVYDEFYGKTLILDTVSGRRTINHAVLKRSLCCELLADCGKSNYQWKLISKTHRVFYFQILAGGKVILKFADMHKDLP